MPTARLVAEDEAPAIPRERGGVADRHPVDDLAVNVLRVRDRAVARCVRVHPEDREPVASGTDSALLIAEEHRDVVARTSEVLEAQEVRREDVVREDLDDLGTSRTGATRCPPL